MRTRALLSSLNFLTHPQRLSLGRFLRHDFIHETILASLLIDAFVGQELELFGGADVADVLAVSVISALAKPSHSMFHLPAVINGGPGEKGEG